MVKLKEEKGKIKRNSNKITTFDICLVVFFIVVIIATLYPFLNVVAISLNDSLDTVRGMNFIIPRKFTWANYEKLFREEKLLFPFLISVLRTVAGTITNLAATVMISFVFSRRDFYFNKLFTIIFIVTMYVSGGLVPEYLLIARTLRLSNSFLVYIIPSLIWVYNILLVRSFIDGLPTALQESAQIDGANDFIVFYKIIVPLCKPVLATVALFVAVGQWNSFMDTYFYARNLPTLQYKLYEILNDTGINLSSMHQAAALETVATITPQSVRMAITVIVTVPIVVVYPFLQKYFVGGMTLGAVKS
ncbi:sugar ABC transporter permease [Anaerocolumna cellulosilytica]|uniref:Sugar ABC transporter permease n=1 Tax=Anaerocolumna cellulosilytica TaxID=433286 RepID=A0A6S6R8Z3_9FIRM|nr:carbohydrate ABC transporter permease [Anaerocolumna cellulosilytica]MBB5195338.1 putative aldouronate transport system permease protein [Anaerocolumna cellulosilytica]BCJ95870.1 sugar ABC transporter permease [Anaerocolumna cellulosilytica]